MPPGQLIDIMVFLCIKNHACASYEFSNVMSVILARAQKHASSLGSLNWSRTTAHFTLRLTVFLLVLSPSFSELPIDSSVNIIHVMGVTSSSSAD
jgi:hypothetical protein